MRILSIDPGLTTGIAIVDGESGGLEASMTVTRKGLFRNGFLSHLVAISKPDVVLIEELPVNFINKDVREIHNHLTSWFRIAGFETHQIKPAQWKRLVQRVEIPGQHARDAATMASWWIRDQEKINARYT